MIIPGSIPASLLRVKFLPVKLSYIFGLQDMHPEFLLQYIINSCYFC